MDGTGVVLTGSRVVTAGVVIFSGVVTGAEVGAADLVAALVVTFAASVGIKLE